MCHISSGGSRRVRRRPPRPPATTPPTVAAAVDSYLDQIPTATTRTSYDDTLARLIAIAGGASPVAERPTTSPQ
jgi:hypothetical protein